MPQNTAKQALLIDFAGTLFLPLDGEQWLTAAATKAKTSLSAHDHAKLAHLLGIRFNRVRDPGRDLSPAAHRQSMLPVLESLTTDKTLAMALYDMQFTDGFWHLRNGAREFLRRAHQQNLRIVIVSNVPWDIRPLFNHAGIQDQIHEFALSCELGIEKPDKLIFQHALSIADCTPSDAVHIGDDPVTDSGALDLGIPVILIPHAPDSTDQALSTIADWLLNTSQHTGTRPNQTSRFLP
jgi:FMN phosphatase YigB (HAD superfamily)